jgi:periplasmic protein TonB
VQGMKVLSGEPELAQAAMDAVEHWRYAPTLVNGRPVNVLTSVSIEFHLK